MQDDDDKQKAIDREYDAIDRRLGIVIGIAWATLILGWLAFVIPILIGLFWGY